MDGPKILSDALSRFDTWAELPEAEREGWLAALAANEPEVHTKLRDLIDADSKATAQSFLRPPTSLSSLAGVHFGPWRVERLIGTGGMAQVWLARRTDGLYDGFAAIKLMRLASADAGANERFAREGRMLGRLSDPNIARLLDAGVTPSGDRYLVLEYIDGERIDTWCNRNRLTLAARMQLFIVVCKAVAHAHENLVVHRDLKPSNIFVTASGEVKLLDFGIAKLLADDAEPLAAQTELTRDMGTVMTPAYAAPEQLAGATISTATDVYALGMVLYELLNGARPTQLPDTGDVSQPLWNLTASPENTGKIAEQRATTVNALRKELRGDAAVVVAKATKGKPAERYRSALEFADELQRVIDQRPIHARPDSGMYRAKKYVQRHAVGVAMSILIVVSIVAGVTGTVINERNAAREAQRAVAVKHFLLDMFEQARTTVQSGGLQVREATMNDVLAAGADRVEKSFASQPEIRDEVFQVLSELYSDSFDPKQAIDLARRRLSAAQSAFGTEDARSAPAEIMLASVLIVAGEVPEATPLLAHAQTLLDHVGDDTSIDRARLLRWQGILVLINSAKPSWHEHPLRRAVELLRARYSEDGELLAALVSLPSEACRYGETAEAMASAEELYRRTVAHYGANNLFVDTANLLRGQLLVSGGRATDAVPVLEQALEGYRRHVGDKNQNTLLTQLELSEAYQRIGKIDESQRIFTSVEQAMVRDHADDKWVARMVAKTRANLAKLQAGDAPHGCGS